MARAFFGFTRRRRGLQGRQACDAKAGGIAKRLALESLEPRAMLTNVAPVAVGDTLLFYGSTQRNVTIEAATYIEAGSTWFYSDDGSDQRAINPDWNAGPEAGFDPATGGEPGWTESGVAPLGFGDPVATTLRGGYSAYYFQRPFNVDGPIPERMLLGLQVDDCAAVYINGVEVHRTANFGFGPISHNTLCASGTPSETTFFESLFHTWNLNLQPTGNTIAVEVHQASLQSSDVRFDLRLQRGNAGLLANDHDANTPHEQLTVEVVDASQAAQYGTLEVSPDGAVAFMPWGYDIGGRFSFTYRVLDNDALEPLASNVATVTVELRGCDCLPDVFAVADIGIPEFVTAEDTPLVINAETGPNGPVGSGVLANDSRRYWGPLSPFVVQQPTSGGRVEFASGSGGFTYTPAKNFVGVDTFRYAVHDSYNLSNDVVVEIVVTPVDDLPVVADDRFTAFSGERFAATATDALILPRSEWHYFDEMTSWTSWGSPWEDYPRDAFGRRWNAHEFDVATSDPAIGPWKVGRGIFAGPVAAPLGMATLDGTTYLLGGDGMRTTHLFRRSFELSAADANSLAELALDMLHDDGAVVYINGAEVLRAAMPEAPAPITSGTLGTGLTLEEYQPYRLAIAPGILLPGTNTIAVEVHQLSLSSSDRGFDLGLYKLPAGVNGQSVLFNDFDPDGDPIFGAAVVPGSGPLGTLVEFRPDGTFVYDPPPGFVGVDSFRYTAASISGTSLEGTVWISVVEPEPKANDDVYSVSPGGFLSIEDAARGVLANDLHLRPTTGVLISQPPGGAEIVSPEGVLFWVNYRDVDGVALGDGSFVFTPAEGVSDAQFRYEYTLFDTSGIADRATLIIHISDASYDLNGDGPVDSTDLAVLVGNFGIESGATNADGDLNRDGRVSLADVLLLRAHLGVVSAQAAAAVARTESGRLNAEAVDRGFARFERLAVARRPRPEAVAAETSVNASGGDAAGESATVLAASRLRTAAGRRVGRG